MPWRLTHARALPFLDTAKRAKDMGAVSRAIAEGQYRGPWGVGPVKLPAE